MRYSALDSIVQVMIQNENMNKLQIFSAYYLLSKNWY